MEEGWTETETETEEKTILITESQPTEPNLEGHNNTSAVAMPPQGVVPKNGEDIEDIIPTRQLIVLRPCSVARPR